MSATPTLEQWQKWWERLEYEIPPWAWRTDPKLEGMTQEQFEILRACQEMPTELPKGFP